MVSKTVLFEADIESQVSELARINRRSFSSQVVHMIEAVIKDQSSEGAMEIRRFMDGCPAAKAIEAMTEGQS